MITDTCRHAPYSIRITQVLVCFDLRDETINQVQCPKEFIQYSTRFAIEAYGEMIAVLGCDDSRGYQTCGYYLETSSHPSHT